MPFNSESKPLKMSLTDDSEYPWQSEEQVFYTHPNTGISILIPIHTRTNFGSFPAFVKPLINNDDPRVIRPTLLHDYIFQRQGNMPSFYWNGARFPSRLISLTEANNLMFWALIEERYPTIKAWAVLLGLKIGSWWSWYFE